VNCDANAYGLCFVMLRNMHLTRVCNTMDHLLLQGGPKIWHTFLRFITASNIDQLSNVFHCQNRVKNFTSTISKHPTTPQMCRYTTL